MRRVLALATGVLLVSAGLARVEAQSLGEAAARQKDKRKGKTSKIYTEDDLRRAGGTTTASATSSDGGEAPAPAEGAPAAAQVPPVPTVEGSREGGPTEEQQRAEKEKAWRERWTKANDEVTRLTGEVTKLQGIVDGSPLPVRPGWEAKLQEAQKLLGTAKQNLDTLDDERRWNGFKP